MRLLVCSHPVTCLLLAPRDGRELQGSCGMSALVPAAVVSDAVTTATSQEQLLSETDSNVDDRVRTPPLEAEVVVSDALVMIEGSRIPLLVFVNSRSGGQQGKPLLAQFSSWLRPEQVRARAHTTHGALAQQASPLPNPSQHPHHSRR